VINLSILKVNNIHINMLFIQIFLQFKEIFMFYLTRKNNNNNLNNNNLNNNNNNNLKNNNLNNKNNNLNNNNNKYTEYSIYNYWI